MSLSVEEFIRRFTQHFLPRYFIKIRHYGIFSTRVKKQKLALIRKSLKQAEPPEKQKLSAFEVVLKTTGVDLKLCTTCLEGQMVVLKITRPIRGSPRKLTIGNPEKT
jgi:hypothetical protein|tara:strand:+ start:149 stop:469 length:321 start_codon:yes stop_codon:yes gene_type:complete